MINQQYPILGDPDRIYRKKGSHVVLYALQGQFIVYYWFGHSPNQQFCLNRREFDSWIIANNFECLN